MPTAARKSLNHAVREDKEVQREVVDIEPFVIQRLHLRHVGRFERIVASAGHGHGREGEPPFRDTP